MIRIILLSCFVLTTLSTSFAGEVAMTEEQRQSVLAHQFT